MGVVAIGYLFYTQSWSWLFVTAIAYIVLGPINIGLTLHRLLTHKSFTTHPFIENFLSIVSVFSTLGPTISWVGLHRYHHANSDQENDPHSPHDLSSNKVTLKQAFIAWTGIGWNIPRIPLAYVKDMMKKPLHKFILDNYFKILISGILLITLIDPVLVLFLYFLPTALAFHGVNAINVYGHYRGYRNFETTDRSTNNLLVHALTWDCLHNNHHRYPGAWNNKHKWWELDPLSWIIRVIRYEK
jgi:stearoyl-CoA desaturase (delta-9 desaturase)